MIKVVSQGLGPIGRKTIEEILLDKHFELVGAIDINPGFVGKDLGKILGNGNSKLGIKISDDAEKVFKKTNPDIVILTIGSELDKIKEPIISAVNHKINVLTPAEELFYPQSINIGKANYFDRSAIKNGVSILSRGINPGCLLDSYVLKLLKDNNIDNVFSLRVVRRDNIAERREPLLNKTGVGLTKDHFYDFEKKGLIGHIGLKISAAYLADNLGFDKYKIDFKREPVIAYENLKTKSGRNIFRGEVSGLHEKCNVVVNGVDRIFLDLEMHVGASNRNSTEVVYRGGRRLFDYSNIVNGDIATVRILKDAIIPVVNGEPGLNKINYVPDPTKLLIV